MRKNVREAKHIKNEDSMWELEHGGPASRLIGGEAIPSVLTPSTEKEGSHGYKVVPLDQRYENAEPGKSILHFEKYADRKFIFETSPYPGDGKFEPAHAHPRRFDMPPVNFEI
jgi:hypothetical protein